MTNMKDNLKEEYLDILNKIDELTKVFDGLEKETIELKVRYHENPKDEALLVEIKNHEEKYKKLYQQMQVLNLEAKALKDKYSK